MGKERYEHIRAYLADRKNEIKEALIELARIPSEQGEAFPDAPFGRSCDDALRAVKALYEKNGYKTVYVPDSGYVLGYTGNSSERTVGLFTHTDVVPAGEGWTYTNPYEPIEKDGFIIGRGGYDNKSGIIMALYASKAIEESGLPFSSRIMLFAGANEETGMADIRAFTREQKEPELSLVLDNGFPICRGERGIFRWYGISEKSFSDEIVSLSGGEAFNALLGTLSVSLKYTEKRREEINALIKNEDDYSLFEDGETLTLTAHGVTAHAAYPGDAVHGMYRIGKLLSNCTTLCEKDREIFSEAAELTSDCRGSGFGIDFTDSEFGRNTCVNGIVALENGHLSLSFDSRYASFTPEEIEKTINNRLTEIGWRFKPYDNSGSYCIPLTDKTLELLLNTYKECTGKLDARPYLSAGGTYARFLSKAFSLADVGSKTHLPMMPGHGGAHQPDEAVSLEGLLDSAAIVAEMILSWDGD